MFSNQEVVFVFYKKVGDAMLLFIYILLILIALVFLIYIYLLIKRIIFIAKIKSKCGENICFKRNIISSVLIPNGKTDIELSFNGVNFDICILTTPFRRVRYHFPNEEKMEIVVEKRGVFIPNRHSANIKTYAACVDRVYNLKKYNMNFDFDGPDGISKYVIVNPAPRFVSKVSGTQINILMDGDILFRNVHICGARYFLDKVLK